MNNSSGNQISKLAASKATVSHKWMNSRQSISRDELKLAHQAACLKAIFKYLGQPVPEGLQPIAATIQSRSEAQDAFVTNQAACVRRVQLGDPWWRHRGGPMLGFHRGDGHWVAILPKALRGFEVYDPQKDSTYLVRSANAKNFFMQALHFSVRLPSQPLNIWHLLKLAFRGQGWDLAGIGILSLGLSLIGLLIPITTGFLVDQVMPQGEQQLLALILVLLGLAGLSQVIFGVLRGDALLGFQGKIASRLQPAVWDRLFQLPVSFFRKFTSGDLILRALAVDSMTALVSNATLSILFSAVFSSFYLVFLFFYHPTLAWFAVLITILAAMPMVSSFLKVRIVSKSYELEGQTSGILMEMLGGMVKLKSTASEPATFRRWFKLFLKKNRLDYQAGMLDAGVSVWNACLPLAAMLVLFSVAMAYQTGAGGLSVGGFAAFYAIYNLFLGAALGFLSTLFSLLSLIPLYQRAKPVLRAVPEQVPRGKVVIHQLQGRLDVRELCFSFEQSKDPVIQDVSFSLKPGTSLAIVGRSGSGKTTLLKLLIGFFNPSAGSIFYDEKPLDSLNLAVLRRQFGVVLQGSKPLPGTLLQHMAGALPMGQEDIWRALRLAALEDVVKDFPMGIHTYLAEAGATLSGGQCQRFMIAKAVARKPRFLFLDEATSALDNRVQARVVKNLAALAISRVFIAHRLSTIRGADHIIVLDKGRIVQQGDFHTLNSEPGLFQQMAEAQRTD